MINSTITTIPMTSPIPNSVKPKNKIKKLLFTVQGGHTLVFLSNDLFNYFHFVYLYHC